MAVSESILVELSGVFDARCQAECLYMALEALQDSEKSNPLVHLMRCHVERWAAACDALEKTIRQRALPVLVDFEGVAK